MLTKEFIEAKKELEKAQAEIMRNPVWGKNKKALKGAEEKMEKVKQAIKEKQISLWDGDDNA